MSAVESAEQAAETARVDEVLAARALSSAEYLAGLIADGQLDTVGSPRKLPMDLFPDVDPEVVQRVWERALVVGVRAGKLMQAPRFYRDTRDRLRRELEGVGFEAMAGLSRRALESESRYPELHAVDDEDARGH